MLSVQSEEKNFGCQVDETGRDGESFRSGGKIEFKVTGGTSTVKINKSSYANGISRLKKFQRARERNDSMREKESERLHLLPTIQSSSYTGRSHKNLPKAPSTL